MGHKPEKAINGVDEAATRATAKTPELKDGVQNITILRPNA